MANNRNQILKLEDEKRALKQALERHRIEADHTHKYYVDTGKKCAAEWAEIRDLERSTSLTDEEEEQIHCHNCRRLSNEQTGALLGLKSAAG